MRTHLFCALAFASALHPASALNPVIEPLASLTGAAPPQIAVSNMDVCPTKGDDEMSLTYSRSAEIAGAMYIWHVYALAGQRYCALLESPSALALTGDEYALLESAANANFVPPDFVGEVWPRACDTLISAQSTPASFGVRVRSDLTVVPPTLASAPEYCIAFGDYLLHARQRLSAQSSMHYLLSYGGRSGSINSESIVDPRGGIRFPPNVEHCEPFCYPTSPVAGVISYTFTYPDNPVASTLGGAVTGYPNTSPPTPPYAIGLRDGTTTPGTARAASFAQVHFTTIDPSTTPSLPYLTLHSPFPLQVIDPLDPPISIVASSSAGSGSLQYLLNGVPFTTLPNSQLRPDFNIVTVRRSDGLAASNKVRALVTTGTFSPNNDPPVITLPQNQAVYPINIDWTIHNPPASVLDAVELWRRSNNEQYFRQVSNAAATTTYSESAPMNTTYTYQLRKRYASGSRLLDERSFRGNNLPPQVVSVSPGQGAVNVPVLAEFQVNFDQDVQTSINWLNLRCGTVTPLVYSYGSGSTRTLRVQWGAPIPAGATCTATIQATGVTDLVNQRLPANYSWTFTASECDYAGWTSVEGSPLLGTPSGTPSVKRYSGNCGIQVDAVGDYLIDNTPTNETSYKTRFYYYTGNRSGAADIFQARSGHTSGMVIYRVRHDGASLTFSVNGTTETRSVAVSDNRWYMVQMQWAAGGGDGSLTMNVVGAGSPTSLNTPPILSINNPSDFVEEIRIGLINGSNNTVTAPVPAHFDAYQGDRQILPARLCRGDASDDGAIGAADRVHVTNEILGSSLAPGQPDADEDGGVGAADRVVLTNAILDGKSCAEM